MEENKLDQIKPEDNTQTIFTTDDFAMEGYDKHIRQARNACFISAALLLINAILGKLFNTSLQIFQFWVELLSKRQFCYMF